VPPKGLVKRISDALRVAGLERDVCFESCVQISSEWAYKAVEPDFEKRHVQFLYRDPSDLHFMDMDSYDQFALPIDGYSQEAGYLTDNLEGIRSLVLEDEVIGIELPLTVDIVITECDPAVKGNSATARQKNATLETGLVIQVPEHISSGENVRVDTTNGKFISRAKD